MTIVITGGTRGIGRRTAIELARRGHSVTITARDRAAGERAVADIRSVAAASARVDLVDLDLGSLPSIRRCADGLGGSDVAISGLVLNAGINTRSLRSTSDGFESTFGVNHLGHYLLTHLLVDHLAPAARVIFVASDAHNPDTAAGRRDAPEFTSARLLADPATAPVADQARYGTSKLANLYTAYEFSRRLHERAGGAAASVNAFDPGGVPGTGLTREWSRSARALVSVFSALRFLPMNVNSVETSGAALARLMVDPEFAAVSGRYFGVRGEKYSSHDSYDQRVAGDLFVDSAELVGLKPGDSPLAPATLAR